MAIDADGKDWGRVGAAIRARMDQLHLSRGDALRLAQEGGDRFSDASLDQWRSGEPVRRMPSRRGLGKALGWTPESFDQIAAGGEPTEVVSPTRPAGPLPPDNVSQRLRRMEERLDRLDQVIHRLDHQAGEVARGLRQPQNQGPAADGERREGRPSPPPTRRPRR